MCPPLNKALPMRKGGGMAQARHHRRMSLDGRRPTHACTASSSSLGTLLGHPQPMSPTVGQRLGKGGYTGLVSEAFCHLGGLCVEQRSFSFPTELQQ